MISVESVSNQTIAQVSHIKVNDNYVFPQFGELAIKTIFRSAWEFDKWKPRIIKMAGENEK